MKSLTLLLSVLFLTASLSAFCPGNEKRSACPGHDKLIECPNDGK
ncbi:hypothetical protein P3G55_15870 [Leptospira sp. 96542]|nr:hypothetical protein [Leptospira sp. 96542]